MFTAFRFLRFLMNTNGGRILGLLALLAAAYAGGILYIGHVRHVAYKQGVTAEKAAYRAEQIKAAAQASNWLEQARARQQAARDGQAQADAKFKKQQAAIHAAPGGDKPLPPYLANASRRMFPR